MRDLLIGKLNILQKKDKIMTILHIDIETIPSQLQWVKDDIKSKIKPPGNIKKQESIDKWMAENADQAAEEQWLKTSFNGAVGEIVAIAWAFDDDPINGVVRGLGQPESDLINQFNDDLKSVDVTTNGTKHALGKITWCGHYITGFDLHFIWQRFIVNNIVPWFDIPHNAKPWSDSIFDTCHEWKGDTSGFGSLDTVAKILGIEGKTDGMDGSQVWPEIQAGNTEKVLEYCKDDVRIARQVYNRIK